MLINRNIKVIGQNVYLVPYEKQHVPKYHLWMTNKELQALTASEPLTLEEEYKMQKSWREDEDKCTFIILSKAKYDQTGDEIESMIGDTNIFIKDKEEAKGEIEIMIAEESSRGQKLGWESAILMLTFGIQYIGLKIYEAKISLSNEISIKMFEKLGFQEKCISEIFQEITLEKVVTENWKYWLAEQCKFELVTLN